MPIMKSEQNGDLPQNGANLPAGLRAIILFGHLLPPVLASRFRELVYPFERARRDQFSAVIPGLTGSAIFCESDEKITYEFMINGYWDWRVLAAASVICGEGDVVIECGANVGTETAGFSDIVSSSGRVYAFEALPVNFQKLTASAALFQHANAELFPMAVSDASGDLFFRPPAAGAGGGGLIDPQGSIRVSGIALDDLSERFGTVKLIHMDIEGAEILALRGAKRILASSRPFLIVECLPKILARLGFTGSDLIAELKDIYHLFRIDRFSLAEISLQSNPYYNWIAIPKGKEEIISRINRRIRAVGLLPCLSGIHPLSHWKIRSILWPDKRSHAIKK